MARKRTAVLISGRGSNMAALIQAAADKTFPAEIVLVVSDRSQAPGLAVARNTGIETALLEHTAFVDRAAFDRALQSVLEQHRIELICLAGFMRVLTPWLVGIWQGHMLNIHPALLPAFKGLHTHELALAAGVKLHGATVHFVVPEIDSGPIVMQAAVEVLADDTPQTLAARVLAAEHCIYPTALRWLAEDRLRVADGRVTLQGAELTAGILIAPNERNEVAALPPTSGQLRSRSGGIS